MGASFVNLTMSLLIFLLFSILCISIGIIIGSLFTVNQVSGIGSLFITAFGPFRGAWMDLKMIGGIFEKVGSALPFAHTVDATKILLSAGKWIEISGNFYWIFIYSIVLFLLAVMCSNWAMKKA